MTTRTTNHSRCESNGRYDLGCRCPTCTTNHADNIREYRRRRAERHWGVYHKTTRVDPTPATEAVLEAHFVRGISRREISEVTGISIDTINDLINGQRTAVFKQTNDLIMRFYGPGMHAPRKIPDEQLVPVAPWVEWLDRLRSQGWTYGMLRKILEDSGRDGAFIRTDIRQSARIRYENAKRIKWLIETIGDRHGPATRNRMLMQKRGVFPLIHYTEDGRLIRDSLTREQRAFL